MLRNDWLLSFVVIGLFKVSYLIGYYVTFSSTGNEKHV